MTTGRLSEWRYNVDESETRACAGEGGTGQDRMPEIEAGKAEGEPSQRQRAAGGGGGGGGMRNEKWDEKEEAMT